MNPVITTLYEIRGRILDFYAKQGKAIDVFFRFIAAFLMQMSINNLTGYFSKLTSIPVMLAIAAICCILPWWIITFFMGILIMLHLLKVSIIITGIVLFFFLSMILIDLIFAPGYSGVIFFVPVAFMLKLPFLLPIILGLVFPVTAVVPMVFGVMVYYILYYVNSTAGLLANAAASSVTEETANMLTQMMKAINGIIGNNEMYSVMAAFTVTAVIVYILHRLAVENSWMIAVITGAIVDMTLIVFANAAVLDAKNASMSVGFVVVGSIISCLIALGMQFMLFSADYKHTENVQFEDDDFYYYVKAVPKVRINGKVYDNKVIESTGDVQSDV